MRLYNELAPWFHLITHPSEYADEADHLLRLVDAADIGTTKTLLELGSGGGNLASHLTQRFACTLIDVSEDMLSLSRAINPDAEHIAADMRSLRLGREFDVVLAHDALGYMTSVADLSAAIMTAAAHLRPGGLAVFIPDAVTEQLRTGTDHGGVDGEDGRSARYLEWTHGILTMATATMSTTFFCCGSRESRPAPSWTRIASAYFHGGPGSILSTPPA